MAKKTSKAKKDLAEQTDPRAPLDSVALLAASKPLLAKLEVDLLERVKASPTVTAALDARYQAEKANHRTAESFASWTSALATQVAAAWLLSSVFVRTLEDRGLLKQNRLAGPGAEDSQRQFFALAPSLTERDYLLTIFRELAHHPAAKELFDTDHSLVWKLSPSAEVAKELLALFRAPNATTPAFRFGQPSTRFLGDLYQDLSEEVRKRYALLQTPDFVEEFILDRTLEPAIERFGLNDTTLIDPTCGSGHFLLGAFERMFEHRLRYEPGIDHRSAAVKALDAIYGADINPYAVAIARFRLTLSFLDKAGYSKLADAPALPLHLVVADSLRINPQHPQQELWHQDGVSSQGWLGDVFTLEDERAAKDVLFRQFAAVVGNPPYITPKDRAQRTKYAEMYKTCFMNYALSVPFCERFFQLARGRGLVGQITANSFIKREFGSRLIEEFLPTVNLERIVNISGAYIPGHGTPTVLLFGTHEAPQGSEVSAVLAKRGEPSTPKDPREGAVWKSVEAHFDEVGFENDYIKTEKLSRDELGHHPWCIGEGRKLKKTLEESTAQRLKDVIADIGYSIILGEEDAFMRPARRLQWAHLPRIPIVIGEEVRDWAVAAENEILRPFDANSFEVDADSPLTQELWPWRTVLKQRVVSGSTTMEESGKKWFDVRRLSRDKHKTPLTLVFAFVATHNHFVLDRGGRVFSQSAPVIKLSESARESEHLTLLAYLNSSTACFWLKQVCFEKYSANQKHNPDPVRRKYEFASTAISELPIPDSLPTILSELSKQLLSVAGQQAALLAGPHGFLADSKQKLSTRVDAVFARWESLRQRALVLQEEIDWVVYETVGISEAQGAIQRAREILDDETVLVPPGGRPFELVAGYHQGHTDRIGVDAQRVEIESLPKHWQERAALVSSEDLQILERGEFKRVWRLSEMNTHPDRVRSDIVTGWLRSEAADVLETVVAGASLPIPLREFVTALSASGQQTFDYLGVEGAAWTRELLLAMSVPQFSTSRLTESGLAKADEWVQNWAQQRREDEGLTVRLQAPSKYEQTDMASTDIWRLRGPLDVPKERLISYPRCDSDGDGEPVYGWAGWDYLQRAHALGSLYLKRKDEGWTPERLTPMLAGILELIPWVKQWHNEPSQQYDGQRMGDYYEQFLNGECQQQRVTYDDLRAWRPPAKQRGRVKGAMKVNGQRQDDSENADVHQPLEALERGLLGPEQPTAKPPANTKLKEKRTPRKAVPQKSRATKKQARADESTTEEAE